MNITPTQKIDTERRNIAAVVEALDELSITLGHGRAVDVALLQKAAEFLRIYADRLHQGKEEAFFFPMLAKRGVSLQSGPIAGLNQEHERSRALLRSFESCIAAYAHHKPGSTEALLRTLREISDLYGNHILKDDAQVLPVADRILTDADKRELADKFSWRDQSIGLEVVARLEKFANSLVVAAEELKTASV